MGWLTSRQRFGAAALILGASAFLSRIIGLIRDKIISWQFGASSEADLYFAAFVIPDIINYLLAGGFMSITIIPLLAKGFKENEAAAWRFFSCISFWMFAASFCLALAGEFFSTYLAQLTAPGFDSLQISRLASFMRIILPAQIFFLSGSCFTALLLLRRQFVVPAFSPLIYNGSIIICGVALPFLAADPASFGMTGYCIGVTLGAFAGAFLLPLAAALKGNINMSLVFYHPWLKKFLVFALPLMLGQTVIMLDEQFLRVFGSFLEEGSVSLLNYARRIAQVPIGLMGQALAVASYPFLVQLLAENKQDQFNEALRKALRAGLLLIVPCAVWMATSIMPILGIIFQGGRFGLPETLACTPLAQILLAASPCWIIYMVIVRAYYAYGDTITPALTGTIVALVSVPCYYFLALPQGIDGVAAMSAISVSLYVFWLFLIWLKRKGGEAFKGLGGMSLKIFACAVPAGALSWSAGNWILFNKDASPDIFSYFISLSSSGVLFGAVFFVALKIFAPDFLLPFLRFFRLKRS